MKIKKYGYKWQFLPKFPESCLAVKILYNTDTILNVTLKIFLKIYITNRDK